MQYNIVIFLKNSLIISVTFFENDGKMTSWEYLRAKLDLDEKKIFYC